MKGGEAQAQRWRADSRHKEDGGQQLDHGQDAEVDGEQEVDRGQEVEVDGAQEVELEVDAGPEVNSMQKLEVDGGQGLDRGQGLEVKWQAGGRGRWRTGRGAGGESQAAAVG